MKYIPIEAAKELANVNGYHLFSSDGEFGWLVLKDKTAPADVDIEMIDDGSPYITAKGIDLYPWEFDEWKTVDRPDVQEAIEAAEEFWDITDSLITQ